VGWGGIAGTLDGALYVSEVTVVATPPEVIV
jgi:hypothetical protein